MVLVPINSNLITNFFSTLFPISVRYESKEKSLPLGSSKKQDEMTILRILLSPSAPISSKRQRG